MKKRFPKFTVFAAVLMLISVFFLTGCGKTEDIGVQTMQEAQFAIPERKQEVIEVHTDAEVPTAADTVQTRDEDLQRILAGNPKTQAEWDELARKKRTALEEKVKAAEGISEEKAVETAQKAMEADLGADAKELVLTVDETFGWKSDLCIADWSEIKEKDRGTLVYCINFNNGQKVADFKDLINYNCTVSAVDGSILEAYSSRGLDENAVYYEHEIKE